MTVSISPGEADRPETTVGICICTARRPQMLHRCLESLLLQRVPEGWRYEICVIENDVDAHSRDLVRDCAKDAAVAIHYYQEPRRGIPFARNKTIEVSLANGYDWMALIDDDETATPGWLETLIVVAGNFDADVVNGPVRSIYQVPPPDWWEPPVQRQATTGQELDEAPTNNTLLSIRLVSTLGIRFDEALTCGLEDLDFFGRAHRRGAKIVWAAEALVNEEVPATRLSTWGLLRRIEMTGASLAFIARLRGGLPHAVVRYGWKGTRRLVGGVALAVVAALIAPFAWRFGRRLWYRAAERLARGLGNIRGLTRFKPRYYRVIDGN